MTALLEIKQKIKRFYAEFEIYLLPIIKFLLALASFYWINENMGYLSRLDNLFIVLILSLICCILPSGVMVFVAFLLMILHGYGLGIEVAGFLLVVLLFMLILFLRFSAGKNVIMVLTPLAYSINMPVLLPIGSGLLSSAASALPASCGVILYYFVRFIRIQSEILGDSEVAPLEKITLMADGLSQNWAMWLNVVAVVLVILVVNLIRTRSVNYAWRIAILVGGFLYVAIMLAGGYYLNVEIHTTVLAGYTGIAVLIGLLLEFFVFGGDYTRIERLRYEDDDYYYYVKAVPKSTISTSERSIKKITAEPVREEKNTEERVLAYANPIFRGDGQKSARPESGKTPENLMKNEELEDVDFEKKLEESLRDL